MPPPTTSTNIDSGLRPGWRRRRRRGPAAERRRGRAGRGTVADPHRRRPRRMRARRGCPAAAPRPGRRRSAEVAVDGVDHQVRSGRASRSRARRRPAARSGSLILAIDLPTPSASMRELGGHDVAVVALGQRRGRRRRPRRRPGARTSSSVPSPRTADAAERRRQPVEGVGRDVEDDRPRDRRGRRPSARAAPTRPQPTMTIFTLASSGIGSRTTQTAHGAFCRTYGMVRPMANSPPKRRSDRAGRATSRSASALDRLVDDGRADVAGLEQDRLEADLSTPRRPSRRCRARAGPPPSGRRCRRRAAASSRSPTTWTAISSAFVARAIARRRGGRSARRSSPPLRATDGARWNGGVMGIRHGSVTIPPATARRPRLRPAVGADRRSVAAGPARRCRAGVDSNSAGSSRRYGTLTTTVWGRPRSDASAAASRPGCRGSAPTSCGRRTRG